MSHLFGALTISKNDYIVIIIAHPDDETMFFSPLFTYLHQRDAEVHLLCLSTGNADGKGSLRVTELYKAALLFGLRSNCVDIIDSPLFVDGMKTIWPIEDVAKIVAEHIPKDRSVKIFTFDELGASGHVNHIAVHNGVKLAIENQSFASSQYITAYYLQSRPLYRRFIGILDPLLSFFFESLFLFTWNPIPAIQGMIAHQSQFVWYRRLYIIFSAMTYCNAFQRKTNNRRHG